MTEFWNITFLYGIDIKLFARTDNQKIAIHKSINMQIHPQAGHKLYDFTGTAKNLFHVLVSKYYFNL